MSNSHNPPGPHPGPSPSSSSSSSSSGSGAGAGSLAGSLAGAGALAGAGSLAGSGALAGAGAYSGSASDNLNLNGNGNGNLNGNANGNFDANSNLNGNCNLNGNLNDNTNTNTNNVDVNVCVDVKADVCASAASCGPPDVTNSFNVTDSPCIDLTGVSNIGNVLSTVGAPIAYYNGDVMTFSGGGTNSAFHLDQMNDLVANNTLTSASVSNTGDCFTQYASNLTGGEATAGNGIDHAASDTASATVSAAASATATLDAFTQNIVMGANIQYNTMSQTVVGGDVAHTSSIDLGSSGSGSHPHG